GHPCSEQDLLQGRVELGDGDVLPHRAVEQKGFLEHHPDIAPQVVELDVARVHAIESYYALLRGVQPLDQARQRRFPAPAAPDDADHVTGRYPEGDAIDRARLRHVREHDVVEFDISANRWRDAALNAAFRALVHHFAQHAHREQHLLILVDERDDLDERAGYPSREHLEGDQRADADGAIEDVGRADRDDGHQHELLQQLRARLREGGNLADAKLHVGGGRDARFPHIPAARLERKGLHGGHAVYGLHQQSLALRLRLVEIEQALAERPDQQRDDRADRRAKQQQDQRQLD